MIRRALILLLAAVLAAAPAPAQSTEFSRLVGRLSEPGGFFDSDNLVSNETSYLHVMGALRQFQVKGGVYIGVGPEQSFSYIAEIEPEYAVLIDIRRDNLLLHLLLKAMFETSENRIEYLCQLFGRPAPADSSRWGTRDLAAVLGYIDHTPMDSVRYAATHASLMRRVAAYGVPLADEDRATLRRFHDDFAHNGLDLTFTSLGRPPRRAYPNLRRLYGEYDLDSNQASYIATEERWQRVRRLQVENRVIPVVGNLAGPLAMKNIGAWLRETRRTVSAFYVSNVEMYLYRDGSFPAFAANVRALPARSSALIIRSWFNRGFQLPGSMPDHFSTQLVQSFPRFIAMTTPDSAGTYPDYMQLVTDGMAGLPAWMRQQQPR